MTTHYGATPEEWAAFIALGLTPDLLPVVSNAKAVISHTSKLKGLGKTPSRYDGHGEVVGIPQWTQKQSTDAEVAAWSKNPDYGICIQTRTVRAIDVDIDDSEAARAVFEELEHLGLPARTRDNASKFLLVFTMKGDYGKRVIKTANGIIEFLATGQQFIAAGTHPSGSRYEWAGGTPCGIAELTADDFEGIWSRLVGRFAVEPPTTSSASTRNVVLQDTVSNDPTAAYLYGGGHVIGSERDGRLHIVCPFEAEHTSDSPESATSYFPANTGGYALGHFKCLHAHCAQRTDAEFRAALGVGLDDFDDISNEPIADDPQPSDSAARFAFEDAGDFIDNGKPLTWFVKGVLPQADLIMLYGESGSGKTFGALDMAAAIALGLEWRGLKTLKSRVGVVAAEGAGGFKLRLRAYAEHNGIDHHDLPIKVMGDAPNFMVANDVKAVRDAVIAAGGLDLLIVDTLAQVTPGANENSGEDMGKAIKHCRYLRRETGATVLLIHHSGKDASKGARGWSGVKAACDCELEVTRSDELRCLTVTKMKDGEDGQEFGFKLVTVNLGEDADGDAITSCVVEHTAGKKITKTKGAKPGAVQQVVIDTLKGLEGVIGPGEIETETVIAHAVGRLSAPPEDGAKDKRREHIRRAIGQLEARRMLESVGNLLRFVASEA